MKTKYIVLFAVMLAFAIGAARPQGTEAREHVTFDPVSTINVAMGKSSPVAFTFHIKSGFHVNSHQPLEQELIPTELRFTPPPDVVLGKVQYPAGVLTSFPFDPTQKLSVYSGDFIIKAVVLSPSNSTAGTYTVHGELKYQACDNNACYPPRKLPIQFDVKIAKSGAGTRARPNAQSPHIHN